MSNRKDSDRRYYEKNRATLQEKAREFYRQNAERLKAYQKDYRAEQKRLAEIGRKVVDAVSKGGS